MRFALTPHDAQGRHERQAARALASLNRARRRIDLPPLAHTDVAWSYEAVGRYRHDAEEYSVDLRLCCCHETNRGSAPLGEQLPIDTVPETLAFFRVEYVVSRTDCEHFGTFVPPGFLDYKAIVVDGFRTPDMTSHILVCRWEGQKIRSYNKLHIKFFHVEGRRWQSYPARTEEKLLVDIARVKRGGKFLFQRRAFVRILGEDLRELVFHIRPVPTWKNLDRVFAPQCDHP